MRNYQIFGYKCISRRQLQEVSIHLIDSEGTRNKEQLFNCMECNNLIEYCSRFSGLRNTDKQVRVFDYFQFSHRKRAKLPEMSNFSIRDVVLLGSARLN